MAGIPSHLVIALREILADCEPFETNRGLRDLFLDKRIAPWRDSVPQSDSLIGRVDSAVAYLHDKRHRDGSNALVLMLLALTDKIDQDDDRHARLENLASQLTASFGPAVPSSAGRGEAEEKIKAPANQSATKEQGTQGEPPSPVTNGENAAQTGKVDFFISYNRNDKNWAEWIAWQLENSGYTTVIQAWDFRPGRNFVADMDNASTNSERTIAVLSPDYLASRYTKPEWNAAFSQDPTGERGILLPIKVRECELKGLLSQIVYISLVGLSVEAAAEAVLMGINRGRVKPLVSPNFPGTPAPEFPS